MVPLVILLAVTAIGPLLGPLGVDYLDTVPEAVALGLAAMFATTAAAHFAPNKRAGLIAIVPPFLPRPDLLVTTTGLLEAAGAIGLLVPGIREAAAIALGLLLLALFPANIYAARAKRHDHAPTTPIGRRTAYQLIFIAACAIVALN